MKYLARPSAKRCWQYSIPGISLSIEFKPIAATMFCLGSLVNGFCLLLSSMISRFFHPFCWLVHRIVSVFPVTEGKGVQFPHNCEYSTIIWQQNISYRKFRWTFFCGIFALSTTLMSCISLQNVQVAILNGRSAKSSPVRNERTWWAYNKTGLPVSVAPPQPFSP